MPKQTGCREETVLVTSVRRETVPISADNSHAVVCDETVQSKRKTRRRVRRKTVKSVLNTEGVLVVDDRGPATDYAAGVTSSSCSHIERKPCKSQETRVAKQSDDDEGFRIIGKKRKPRASHSTRVPPCDKERQNANKPGQTSSKRTELSVSLQCKADHENKPAHTLKNPRGNTTTSKSSEAKGLQRNTTVKQQAEKKLAVTVEKSRNPAKVSHSNNKRESGESLRDLTVVREQSEDAGEESGNWRIVAKSRKRLVVQSGDAHCAEERLRVNKPDPIESGCTGKSSVRFERKRAYEKKPTQRSSSRELNYNIRSILNTMTPGNIDVLSKNFAALSIDTTKRLENTVDLVFEKAIQIPILAQLCAVLCSATQSVSVTCGKSKKTTSFQSLIVRKCQSAFEADEHNRTDSAKKPAEINSCRNSESNEEHEFDYNKIEKRCRKRSVGNCRFIGELFKLRLLKISVLQYCIANLASRRTENAIECLCSLLLTVGKESKQCCNLNETLVKLRVLTTEMSISSRVKFMVKNVLES